MINKEDINDFKLKLLAESKELEEELRSVGRINPNNKKDWEPLPEKMDIMASDDNEVADSIEAYEENTGILKELEIRNNEVASALKRIENNTYGNCEVCKEPIEIERLAANPAASTCKKHMGK